MIRMDQLDIKPGDKLFVYGSLRKGKTADLSERSGQEFVTKDRVNGQIFDVAWFPGAKATPVEEFDAGQPSIIGEVFTLTDENLIRWLDSYEGYPSLFDRCVTKTEEGHDVWVYTYNSRVSESQLIPSGDYDDVREMAVVDES